MTYVVRAIYQRDAALVTEDRELAQQFAADESKDGQTWEVAANGHSLFYQNGQRAG